MRRQFTCLYDEPQYSAPKRYSFLTLCLIIDQISLMSSSSLARLTHLTRRAFGVHTVVRLIFLRPIIAYIAIAIGIQYPPGLCCSRYIDVAVQQHQTEASSKLLRKRSSTRPPPCDQNTSMLRIRGSDRIATTLDRQGRIFDTAGIVDQDCSRMKCVEIPLPGRYSMCCVHVLPVYMYLFHIRKRSAGFSLCSRQEHPYKNLPMMARAEAICGHLVS